MQIVSPEELQKVGEYDHHYRVFRFTDAKSGLKAFVAIYNNRPGGAVGGTRMFSYSSETEALRDVLRLSKAMAYKCAAAGVRYGGGKAVIIGNPETDKTPALLTAYGEAIDQLKGAFYTGEDVGISEADVQYLLTISPYFIGKVGQAGDPSPYAALSTFYALRTASTFCFGSDDLAGKRVGVKGLGKVGSELVRLLTEAGARVVGADTSAAALERTRVRFPTLTIVSPTEIHRLPLDAYAPCALGNEFIEQNKHEIKTKLICGAANNQLANAVIGDWFFGQGIVYVPDYIANAGGLIDVADELQPGGYHHERVVAAIQNKIPEMVTLVLERSRDNQLPTNRVADSFVEEIFSNAFASVCS